MSYTQAQLVAAFTAANNGVAPDASTASLLGAFAAQNQAGQLTDAAVLAYVVNSAQDDVQVAVQAYQFFTGKTPTKAGLDFLTNSAANTADLNDPYYAQFNIENRYINFAANLGLNGEGAASFAATYGGLNFTTFVGLVYETVIGSAYANAAKLNVGAAIADIISRQAAFTQTARDRGLITTASTAAQVDLATKAAVVGYLMAEGVKADVGIYATGANNFVNALIAGNAVHNVNLLTVYSPLGGGPAVPLPANGGGTLTSSPETLTANVFNAPQNYTPGGNDLVNTLQNDDFLTGVGADPTLNVTLGNNNDNGAAVITPDLRGVEVINARFDSTSLSMTLDLQDAQSTAVNGNVDTINITRISSAATVASVINIPESVATSLSVSNSQATGATVNFTYLTVALAGAADKGTLSLSNVDLATVRIEENGAQPVTEGFETLTVNSVGSANKLGVLQAEDVQTLAVTGDRNLTLGAVTSTTGTQGVEAVRYGLGLGNVAGSLSKIDASAFKGNLDITLGAEFNAGKDGTSGLNIQLSVIGGDGNDTFRLTDAVVAGAAGNTDSINGGAGTNTLVVLGNTTIAAAGTVAAPVANVTNIQALQIRSGQDDAAGGGVEATDTVNINADAFDKLATIYIRNEGQRLTGAGDALPWISAAETLILNLTNLTSAQANGLTLAHGTTGNSHLAANVINASLKTATGTADTATVTIVDGVNSNPIFNFQLATPGIERIAFVDNDTESNTVFLNQGVFGTASAVVPALAGSSITLTGGLAGKFFSFEAFNAFQFGNLPGYGHVTDGSVVNWDQAALAATASAGVPATFTSNQKDPVLGSFLAFLGAATGGGGAPPETATTLYQGESLIAGAYLGDVIIRLGDVTRADGVSSQSLTTGVGSDTFIFDAPGLTSAGFTSGDTITAGTGTDILVFDGNTTTIPGTPRIDHQASEWDNLKGIDALRFAGNRTTQGGGVANVGNGARVATTGGGYYAQIDNDFISQTDAGNRLTVINNDGFYQTNSESDLVLDLRGLSQSKWVTYLGSSGIGGADHASTRVVLDDISANSNMILNGGDIDVRISTTGGYVAGNNNVIEVRNTANVSINDLAQSKDFGLIDFTNDQATAQTLTLVLNNTVIEALVDVSNTATTAGTQELLAVTGTDGPSGAALLNIDARSLSGFHGLNVLGSVLGNDVLNLATNVGGAANLINLRGGTGDRVNWFGTTDSSIFTFGAAGTAALTAGTSTTTHGMQNVEIVDVTQQTDPLSQFRFAEGVGTTAVAGTFALTNQIIGFTGGGGNDTLRANGATTSVVLNATPTFVPANTLFTPTATNGFDANGFNAGAVMATMVADVLNEAQVIAAIGTIAFETAGEEAYFGLFQTGGTRLALYHWVSAIADNAATSGELELLGVAENATGSISSLNFQFY